MDENDRAEVRELYFHEAEHAKDRTEWFFIGHAILVEGFFAAASTPWAGSAVGMVGFAGALLWLLAGYRQKDNLNDLRERYESASRRYRDIQDQRRESDEKCRVKKWGRATPLLLVGLPALFTVFWLTALVCSFCCGWPRPAVH